MNAPREYRGVLTLMEAQKGEAHPFPKEQAITFTRLPEKGAPFTFTRSKSGVGWTSLVQGVQEEEKGKNGGTILHFRTLNSLYRLHYVK